MHNWVVWANGQGSLGCCSLWGRKESDRTEWLNLAKVWFPLSSTWTISIFLEFHKCHAGMHTWKMQVCDRNRVESVIILLHSLSFFKFYLYCLPTEDTPWAWSPCCWWGSQGGPFSCSEWAVVEGSGWKHRQSRQISWGDCSPHWLVIIEKLLCFSVPWFPDL